MVHETQKTTAEDEQSHFKRDNGEMSNLYLNVGSPVKSV
jgi:hypothetical protein